MAKGSKTGGKDFKAGQPGGPGRPVLPADIREGRKLNRIEFQRAASKIMFMTIDQAQAFIDNPATSIIEIAVAQILMLAAKKGDHQRLEFLLSRTIGRVKEEVELSQAKSFILHRRNGEEIHMGVRQVPADEAS